ncbi:MAG: zinc ABC transporter substrate-binding protein [Bacteroidales bacterium]|nr:zinc ABC transporter substrate-binding protein [Bacteroidales bacterium]
MKRILLPVLLILFITGCKPRAVDQDQKVITVSIEPFRFFTSAIAGDYYQVNLIVPPGASPATYEPPPAVIRGIQGSGLMIINGYLGFELAWMDRITGLNKDMKILRLADSQDLLAADSHRHGDIIHHTGVDPHFWMSPQSARIIVRDIRDFLVRYDPEHEAEYNINYMKLDSLIRDTDLYIKSVLDKQEDRSFMIFHPSLTYFARDYGLEQIAVESEGKEPSPSELKKLIDIGREKELKSMFVQREFDRKNADIIGREIGAEIIVIDPLSFDWIQSVREIAEHIGGIKSN